MRRTREELNQLWTLYEHNRDQFLLDTIIVAEQVLQQEIRTHGGQVTHRSSIVKSAQDIKYNDVNHAGSVTHICKETKEDHEGPCECICGEKWVRNYKVPDGQ